MYQFSSASAWDLEDLLAEEEADGAKSVTKASVINKINPEDDSTHGNEVQKKAYMKE